MSYGQTRYKGLRETRKKSQRKELHERKNIYNQDKQQQQQQQINKKERKEKKKRIMHKIISHKTALILEK